MLYQAELRPATGPEAMEVARFRQAPGPVVDESQYITAMKLCPAVAATALTAVVIGVDTR